MVASDTNVCSHSTRSATELALRREPTREEGMDSTASTAPAPEVTLREPTTADIDELARIVYEAFGDIHDHHRFPRDFPSVEAAQMMIGAWVPHPQVWGVVAEADGKAVGSNFLDERDPIRGVGPITIDPASQNAGV